jgi:hypothetical protein
MGRQDLEWQAVKWFRRRFSILPVHCIVLYSQTIQVVYLIVKGVRV